MPDPSPPPDLPEPPPERSRLADPRTMSFGEHLEELRSRLIWALIAVAPIFAASIYWGDEILRFMIAPVHRALHDAGLPADLQATAPLETLGAWLKVSGVITIVAGIPIIVYQLWRFVAPGLYEHERRFARFLVPLSVILSFAGLAFLYYVMLPLMLAFLIQFGSGIGKNETPTATLNQGQAFTLRVPILPGDPPDPPPGALWFNSDLRELRINAAPPAKPPEPGKRPEAPPKPDIRGAPMTTAAGIAQQYKISEYISLVFTMSIAFAAGFQTPIIVLLLGWSGIFDLRTLAKSRKYAFFFAFVIAAILTPSPDPFSMTVLALPLYGLYELGLFFLKFLPPERIARGVKLRDFTRPARGRPGKREGPDAGDQ